MFFLVSMPGKLSQKKKKKAAFILKARLSETQDDLFVLLKMRFLHVMFSTVAFIFCVLCGFYQM